MSLGPLSTASAVCRPLANSPSTLEKSSAPEMVTCFTVTPGNAFSNAW
jgi:hypothetical protein